MDKQILYVDGHAGASGDMILAALVDLGFPIEKLCETLSLLPIPLDVKKTTVEKNGIRAIAIQPILPKTKAHGLNDFLSVLAKSKLPEAVREKSISVFRNLAKAEGQVHGKTPNELHFHELGGWDTLFDIVGSVTGFEYFKAENILVAPLNVGSGSIQVDHGTFPVPVPVVLQLLSGFPIYSSQIENELVTPTGAAILSTLGKPSPDIPLIQLEKTGYGAGRRDLPIPNVLRILKGTGLINPSDVTPACSECTASHLTEPLWRSSQSVQAGVQFNWIPAFAGMTSNSDQEDRVLKLETNIDDMNPQFWEHVFEELYEAGAFEVFLSPVVMKKSRPAHVLTVLAPPERERLLADVLFRETTTLGIRRELVSRITLKRKTIQVSTPYGKVPCKVAYSNGTILNVSPEYEDLKTISKEQKIPLKRLHQVVLESLPASFK